MVLDMSVKMPKINPATEFLMKLKGDCIYESL
jgi:hypothetical protein